MRTPIKAGADRHRLLGDRGSLATKTPVKTLKSHWPYATTLSDYIKRHEVYALVASSLLEGSIIEPTEVMNAKTSPKVAMPNRDGFIPDARPELSLYQ